MDGELPRREEFAEIIVMFKTGRKWRKCYKQEAKNWKIIFICYFKKYGSKK